MRLDHVNVRCTDLEVTRRFLEDTVGLKVGWRPPFSFPGYWMVDETGHPVVHMIGMDRAPAELGVVDHIAFRYDDLGPTLARLQALGLPLATIPVPGTDIVQGFLAGPDGLRLEFQGPLRGSVAR